MADCGNNPDDLKARTMQFFSRAVEQPGGAPRRQSVADEMSVEGQVLSFLSFLGVRLSLVHPLSHTKLD